MTRFKPWFMPHEDDPSEATEDGLKPVQGDDETKDNIAN